jgi:sec-independent protein translocase protein TatA
MIYKMYLTVLLGVVGPTEFLLIIVVLLLMFGGKKIPELMKGLGEGIREFKKASRGDEDVSSTSKPDADKKA